MMPSEKVALMFPKYFFQRLEFRINRFTQHKIQSFHFFFFLFSFLGHTRQCSELAPDSALRNYSRRFSGDRVGCLRLNPVARVQGKVPPRCTIAPAGPFILSLSLTNIRDRGSTTSGVHALHVGGLGSLPGTPWSREHHQGQVLRTELAIATEHLWRMTQKEVH